MPRDEWLKENRRIASHKDNELSAERAKQYDERIDQWILRAESSNATGRKKKRKKRRRSRK